jgi:GTP cyclohydrolase FolE2
MNAKPAGASVAPIIEDVQGRADTRRIPIDRVGIKDIFHPVRVKDRSGGHQHTIANFNMYVYLPDNFKGTHMSRFVEILNEHEREISVESFNEMLAQMTNRLNSEAGHLEMTFPYFIMKRAPVTGVSLPTTARPSRRSSRKARSRPGQGARPGDQPRPCSKHLRLRRAQPAPAPTISRRIAGTRLARGAHRGR